MSFDTEKRQNYDQFGQPGSAPGAGGVVRGMRSPFDEAFAARGRRREETDRAGGLGRMSRLMTWPQRLFQFRRFSDIFDQLFERNGEAPGVSPAGEAGPSRAATRRRRRAPGHADIRAGGPRRDPAAPDQPRREAETIDIKIPLASRTAASRTSTARPADRWGAGRLVHHHAGAAAPLFPPRGPGYPARSAVEHDEALLGAGISVPTLEKPGDAHHSTRHDSHARVKDQGPWREALGSEKGDELVVIRIIIPRDLDDDYRDDQTPAGETSD